VTIAYELVKIFSHLHLVATESVAFISATAVILAMRGEILQVLPPVKPRKGAREEEPF
jgi:hypothetical protein